MSGVMNIAIVGLGRAGHFHLNSISALPKLQLKYVVDPLIGKIETQFENRSWEGLDNIDSALSDRDLDAIVVASPTELHYQYIHQSLLSGKHVFSEKPLGKSVKEIKHCFQLANDQNRALYLGFQRRYDKNFNRLKEQLGSIGEPRIVKASSRDNPKPSLSYLSISGNIFHDMLIHDFDMVMHLFGAQKPKSVFAVGHAYDADIKDLGDYDTVLVTLEFHNGLICSIDTSRTASYGYDQRLEIFGSAGMLIAENELESSTKLYDTDGLHQSRVKYSFPQRYKECYQREMQDFIDGINFGKLFNVDENECLMSHLIADAAHQSIVSGRPISFDGFYHNSITN